MTETIECTACNKKFTSVGIPPGMAVAVHAYWHKQRGQIIREITGEDDAGSRGQELAGGLPSVSGTPEAG